MKTDEQTHPRAGLNMLDALTAIKRREELRAVLDAAEWSIPGHESLWARPVRWRRLHAAICYVAPVVRSTRARGFYLVPTPHGGIPARIPDEYAEEWETVNPDAVNNGE